MLAAKMRLTRGCLNPSVPLQSLKSRKKRSFQKKCEFQKTQDSEDAGCQNATLPEVPKSVRAATEFEIQKKTNFPQKKCKFQKTHDTAVLRNRQDAAQDAPDSKK